MSCTPTPWSTGTAILSGAPILPCSGRSVRLRRPTLLTSTSTARCWSQPANTSGTRPTSHGWPRTLRRVSPEPDREGAKPGKLRRSTTGTWWQIFTKRCATGWTPGALTHAQNSEPPAAGRAQDESRVAS